MFENVVKFIATVEGKTSHWFVENGISLDIAEKMALQFVSHIAQIKAQQIQKEEDRKAQEASQSNGEAQPLQEPSDH